VIIKPSDYTPACGELLRSMVAATFGEDRVAVAVGGLTLAKEFPTLRWDHLLYTGSPDADGTLGGLVQQARHLERHLAHALRTAALCSNSRSTSTSRLSTANSSTLAD
jgi:hypothetical protein